MPHALLEKIKRIAFGHIQKILLIDCLGLGKEPELPSLKKEDIDIQTSKLEERTKH